MKEGDNKLLKALKEPIDRLLLDYKQPDPRFKPSQWAAELHGSLADLLFVDKVNNELVINVLISLIYANHKRSDEQIAGLFEDLSKALGSLLADTEE